MLAASPRLSPSSSHERVARPWNRTRLLKLGMRHPVSAQLPGLPAALHTFGPRRLISGGAAAGVHSRLAPCAWSFAALRSLPSRLALPPFEEQRFGSAFQRCVRMRLFCRRSGAARWRTACCITTRPTRGGPSSTNRGSSSAWAPARASIGRGTCRAHRSSCLLSAAGRCTGSPRGSTCGAGCPCGAPAWGRCCCAAGQPACCGRRVSLHPGRLRSHERCGRGCWPWQQRQEGSAAEDSLPEGSAGGGFLT